MQYSMNNLDVADLDRDRDSCVVTGKHKRPRLLVQIWENDGTGKFPAQEMHRGGAESHLRTHLVDMDGDGDPNLVRMSWDAFGNLHLWRNDARDRQWPSQSEVTQRV
jgi:hypothetical protein